MARGTDLTFFSPASLRSRASCRPSAGCGLDLANNRSALRVTSGKSAVAKVQLVINLRSDDAAARSQHTENLSDRGVNFGDERQHTIGAHTIK